MLRFLRHMRKNLLENGHIQKYVWYALGEILLVVVGILVALQLDEWKTARENQALANDYEELLILDLESDVRMLKELKEDSEFKHENAQKLMRVFNKETSVFEDSLSIMIAIQDIGRSNSPEFRNNTYNDLVNTGNIQLFKDREMIDVLMTYYTTDFSDWLDEYIHRLWREYLPVAIDILPSSFLEELVYMDMIDEEIKHYSEIVNYSPDMANSVIQKFQNTQEMDFLLKSISRTHLVHIFFLNRTIERAEEAISVMEKQAD